jgi:glycosyltransferase involved in cell wall biosynthesis
MLGWEFPPFISGGLGTACFGLTKALDELGIEVTFVLPTALPLSAGAGGGRVSVRGADKLRVRGAAPEPFHHLQIRQVSAVLQAYGTPQTFQKEKATQAKGAAAAKAAQALPWSVTARGVPAGGGGMVMGAAGQYEGDLMEQVRRYARLATEIAVQEPFDVVHAHDWMTYPAGLSVSGVTGKPLVVHVHSTEFDRSGDNVNQQVYDIERAGMHGADKIICVSNFTRNIVINRYGVSPAKATVVYNAVETSNGEAEAASPLKRNEKIVLFLGRITMQKGPEYFLAAAKKALEKMPNIRFVMAGSGDMIRRTIEMVAQLGIGQNVTFTGFLRGADVDRVFQMADLYVMPSVSEPFGIAPLEALSHNVPVIISKQSGVSEILTHVLKVDFWDINEMANKILAVLRHPPLQRVLREQGTGEIRKLSWKDSASRCKQVYESLVV